VDANVVVWSLVPSPLSAQADQFFEDATVRQLTLVAPALLSFEVSSVLRRLVYLRALTPDEGEEAFAIFQRMPIRLSQRRAIVPLAWQLAKEFGRPRTYDAAYLAVAQLYGCELWTADEKLFNAVSRRLPWVRWLGDYASS
jgi:predicted nucleic acid-binding protein